ncbi:MAG: Xaa-Pro aminopeptidase [Candidatus Saccharimonadales bacterium]
MVMSSLFTASFFQANRRRLVDELQPTGPIIVTANGLMQRSNDTTFNFRQDSNFWYLTGIAEPDVTLVIDTDHEYLMVPSRSASRTTFDGAYTDQILSDQSGIDAVISEEDGWQRLVAGSKTIKQAYVLAAPDSYIDSHGMYTNPARSRIAMKLLTLNSAMEFIDIRSTLTKFRSIKQPVELRAMQAAIDMSIAAFNRLKRGHFARYHYEYEVDAALTHDFRAQNARHAYEPIVASGKHACTLHYIANAAELNRSQLLLIDAGGEVDGYAADITRTFSLQPPTVRQRAVYDAVLDVQQFAASHIRPGLLLKDYEKIIETYMGTKLIQLGLITSNDTENVRRYYPHATSHFLGLDVHDVGEYDQPLRENMTLTVEPGIYIPAEDIGIRIEDDVLVTAQGHTVLSETLSRKLY